MGHLTDQLSALNTEVDEILQIVQGHDEIAHSTLDALVNLKSEIQSDLADYNQATEARVQEFADDLASLWRDVMSALRQQSTQLEDIKGITLITGLITGLMSYYQNDPLYQLAGRWKRLIMLLLQTEIAGGRLSIPEVKEELILLNVSPEQAEIMLSRLLKTDIVRIITHEGREVIELNRESKSLIEVAKAIDRCGII